MKTKDILFTEVYSSNKQVLEKLKISLPKGEWALFLGAGISISVGLPNWYGLIAQLVAQLLPIEVTQAYLNEQNDGYYKDISKLYGTGFKDENFYEKIQDSIIGNYQNVFKEINVLEAAEYIRIYIKNMIVNLGSNDDADTLEKHIDWHMSHFIRDIFRTNFSKDLKSKEVKNGTLGAVARLMKSDRDSLIHNAVTYNYDNLLEEYLRVVSGCPDLMVHSIAKDDDLHDLSNTNEWSIYHVHGRVPVADQSNEAISETLVLTETDYDKEERVSYSWTNIIQTYFIERTNLIFIGFSGTDYNFRRIIKHVEQDKKGRHDRYIFFLVDNIVETVFSKETEKGVNLSDCIRKMSNDDDWYAFEKLLINHLIHAQTQYWEDRGLTVVWSSIEELASDLDSLH